MARPPGRPPRSSRSVQFNRPVKDYAPPPLPDREPLPDFSLLTEDEKEAIRKRARSKVEADEIDRAREAFLEQEIARLEKLAHPEAHEEEKEITIDLAVFADRLIINGKSYMHGRTYTVKKSLYDAMRDMMARTHKHYADTHRDPARAMMEAAQAIAKDGHPGRAMLSASTGQVTRF